MLNVEWLIVVVGWTIIIMTLSITHLKLHRVGGGLYSLEDEKIRTEKWIVRILSIVYFIAALSIALHAYFPSFDDLQDITRYYFIAIGVLIFIVAIVFFIEARIVLGSNWTWSGHQLRDRHKLITKGPYAKVRHPLYTSYFSAGLASGLILTDSRILIFVILLLPLVYWKAVIEEQHLQIIFSEYKDYKRKTRMFF
jgi:protein-S-isoprenylcysteine O-methyltransferase Ste14